MAKGDSPKNNAAPVSSGKFPRQRSRTELNNDPLEETAKLFLEVSDSDQD